MAQSARAWHNMVWSCSPSSTILCGSTAALSVFGRLSGRVWGTGARSLGRHTSIDSHHGGLCNFSGEVWGIRFSSAHFRLERSFLPSYD